MVEFGLYGGVVEFELCDVVICQVVVFGGVGWDGVVDGQYGGFFWCCFVFVVGVVWDFFGVVVDVFVCGSRRGFGCS